MSDSYTENIIKLYKISVVLFDDIFCGCFSSDEESQKYIDNQEANQSSYTVYECEINALNKIKKFKKLEK